MDNTAYLEYLENLKDPDLTAAEVEQLLDDAAEDPRITRGQYEALCLFVYSLS